MVETRFRFVVVVVIAVFVIVIEVGFGFVVVVVAVVIVVEARFGFVFWESNMGEGGEMRKKKMVEPTKQFCSDQVPGLGPTNS